MADDMRDVIEGAIDDADPTRLTAKPSPTGDVPDLLGTIMGGGPPPADGRCCYCSDDVAGKPWLRTSDGRIMCQKAECRRADRQREQRVRETRRSSKARPV